MNDAGSTKQHVIMAAQIVHKASLFISKEYVLNSILSQLYIPDSMMKVEISTHHISIAC